LTGKRVGQRRFVWCSKKDFQMFIYLLMHAFGVIVFFAWFLYAAIDVTKFGSQPSCNHLVKFVIFYFDASRVTVIWFRVIMFQKIPTDVFDIYPRLGLIRYVTGFP
jgi:hypothetical protein